MEDDETLEVLAGRQHGVIAWRQVRGLSVDRRRVERQVRAGTWRRAERRVLIATAAPATAHQALMARVLAIGDGVVASHHSAAWLWRLPGFFALPADVTCLRGTRGHRPGDARLHAPRALQPHHVTEVDAIPVTSLGRTLFDLAGVPLHPDRIARLVDNVITRNPAMCGVLHETLEELARRGRPGIAVMRQILAERPVGVAVAASGLEARFETILRNAGEPVPDRQVDVGGHAWIGRVDYCDRQLRILFEIDGDLHHTGLLDARLDAIRDAALLAAGWREVVRISERDVWSRPWFVLDQVRGARRRARSGSQIRPELAGSDCQNDLGLAS